MSLAELPVAFAGRKGRLFGLALRTSVLTVLTLGFYRFWMRTRLRRYYWSSIKPGGHPLEYVGEPLEKLLGFLVAVVLMAFYIGVVNLVLMFASYAIFQGNSWAYGVSFLGVIPIIFFAQYRARRYVLARTRWRGIRFGVEPGAWGYAWRALVWWLLTIASLGILWPRKDFALEKYRTDRTFFGQQRLSQGGSPWMLMGAARHLMIGALIAVFGGSGLAAAQTAGNGLAPVAVALILAGGVWFGFGTVYYQVDSFRRLTAAKRMGGVGLIARPRPWRILRIYSLGTSLSVLCLSAILVPAVLLFATLAPGVIEAAETGGLPPLPGWLLIAGGALLYFTIFILWGVLRQVFVGLPSLRHYAETLTVTGAEHLTGLAQRDRDEFAEAEGFADALDVGAAI